MEREGRAIESDHRPSFVTAHEIWSGRESGGHQPEETLGYLINW
jgi:hypothetical protein